MKNIKYIWIVFLAIHLVACNFSDKKEAVVNAESKLPAKLKTSFLQIKGMTCEIGCAKTIESKISKVPGVTQSKVNFEAEQGTFTYDANLVSEANIISTINHLLDGKTYVANVSESQGAFDTTKK